MVNSIKVLDCTLRDGGYLINANFGDDTIRGIIKKLYEAKIDVIECGFLKDEYHKKDTTIFNCVDEVIPYLPEERLRSNSDTSFVLLADCSRYKAKNLKHYDGKSVDGIRECFFKHEIDEAFELAKIMKEKGYKVYIQPVDILGYTDLEILNLVNKTNELEPYAFSIVDTFGSMYKDDLIRIFSLINHNLSKKIKVGFHSHNNMQLSFALCQEFAELSFGNRDIIIDSTICGMGRGAGNANTELIVNYLNEKFNTNYNIDELLDLVDIYMPRIMKQCSWGYSIPYFIAGMYNSHVHNITYLLDKHSTKAKDMRAIIERIDSNTRKKYDYKNLEKLYIEYFSNFIDSNEVIKSIKEIFDNRKILLLMPGKSLDLEREKITEFINKENPIIISMNYDDTVFNSDIIFVSNIRRYESDNIVNSRKMKIITSNIKTTQLESEQIINFNSLIKNGWKYFDNSSILFLRLLSVLDIKEVFIAGFDGFSDSVNYNYNEQELETYKTNNELILINNEIREMLIDFNENLGKNMKINFITNSIFSYIFKK